MTKDEVKRICDSFPLLRETNSGYTLDPDPTSGETTIWVEYGGVSFYTPHTNVIYIDHAEIKSIKVGVGEEFPYDIFEKDENPLISYISLYSTQRFFKFEQLSRIQFLGELRRVMRARCAVDDMKKIVVKYKLCKKIKGI